MTTFDEAMLHRERVLDIRVGKYTGQQVKSASFDYGFQSGDAYTTGGTNAGSAKLQLDGIHTDFEKLQILKPELALLVDEVLEWVKMGTFYISDIKIDRNRNSTTLELIDGMFKLNEPYVSDLVYPAQIRDVIREIAAKTGVELATDNFGLKAIQYHVLAKPTKDKITFREVLGQTCQLLGYNAFFNRDGKLEIRGLTESGIRITADSYFLHGLEKSEIEYQIAGISCKAGKQSLTVGLRTGRSLELDNELMYQNLLDDLYFNLKNIRYYPYSLKWQGHLKLDVGQWVTLVTNKGEIYKVPVFSQSFEFAGGLSSKISANSKASNDTQYTYGSFLTKKITQMATEIEAEVQQQLEWAEREYDEKSKALKKEIEDGIEQAKAAGEQYAAEIALKIQTIVSQIAEMEQLMALSNANSDRLVAEFEDQLEAFKEEVKNIGISDERITELLANAGFDQASLEDLKRRALSNSDTLSTVVDMIGSDGSTTYSRNRATITEGIIPLGTDSLAVGHNGDGFEVGETYVISWEAVCNPHESSEVVLQFETSKMMGVIAKLVPSNPLYPTNTVEVAEKNKTVYAVYHDTYTLIVEGDWYQPSTLTGQEVNGPKTIRVPLAFKTIADGNLPDKYVGKWSERPEITLNGGN